MNVIGLGAYTIQEASRYAGIDPSFISRWLFSRNRLWESQLAETGWKGIGFHDLLELRIVQAFRQRGVSLQLIRQALSNAKELYGQEHPFINRRFATDGKRIFTEAVRQVGEHDPLMDLARRQYVLDEVIRPSLHDGIVYDDGDKNAIRWHPDRRKFRMIVLDPSRSFGKPIIEASGIKTSTLYSAYLAEGDKKFVARLYEVSASTVTSAIRYEEGLDNRITA